jgi:hypothetical protein
MSFTPILIIQLMKKKFYGILVFRACAPMTLNCLTYHIPLSAREATSVPVKAGSVYRCTIQIIFK